ncbi:pyruvate kinase [Candidatus Falkowbacteria bacterium]|nr:pyruvate kinase [Candidatus Falkowbacteria bacterium]
MINKQTKIVATIASNRCEISFIKELHEAGVDVVRLNTAHQSPEESNLLIANVRKASERLAIIVDTKGPEIRTLPFEDGINATVEAGQKILVRGAIKGYSDSKHLLVNYAKLVNRVIVGATLLIDDGEIALAVIGKRNGYLVCRAESAGTIKGKKSVNIPGANLNLPSLSSKDKTFIDWAIEQKIDFIAHSFVRNAKDVLDIQKILDQKKSPIKIIAKIENQAGIDNIDRILDYAYGIMVARGDMGVEIPMEDVPAVQKELIKKCIARQKPVITATQMLHTMINNPRPTRAEVSDVANAILDGTDAVMLSGETAYGDYPVQAVKTMAQIANKFDHNKALVFGEHYHDSNKMLTYLAKSAVKIAEELKAREIIVSDLSAFSASALAAFRPTMPIFVKCADKCRVRELAITYGINAHYVEPRLFGPKLLSDMLKSLVRKEKLHRSDIVVFLSGEVGAENSGHNIEVCQVGKYIS